MAGLDTDPAGPTGGAGDGASQGSARIRGAFDAVKGQAGELAGRATEQGKSVLARQKDSAAEQLESVAHALHGSAERLGSEHLDAAGRTLGYAADRIGTLGRRLRTRDVDALLHDATDVARRAPVTFFAGTVVAGFLLSRFLKASAQRHEARTEASPATGDAAATGHDPWTGLRPDQDADLRSGAAGVPPGPMGRPSTATSGTTGTGTADPTGWSGVDPSGTGAAPWSETDGPPRSGPATTRGGGHGH